MTTARDHEAAAAELLKRSLKELKLAAELRVKNAEIAGTEIAKHSMSDLKEAAENVGKLVKQMETSVGQKTKAELEDLKLKGKHEIEDLRYEGELAQSQLRRLIVGTAQTVGETIYNFEKYLESLISG